MALPAILAVLAGLATGMSTVTAIAVRWAAFARRPLTAGIAQFLLAMMAGMLVGVLVYFGVGGAAGLASGLWAASAIMSASVIVVFLAFVREVRAHTGAEGGASRGISRSSLVASVIGLVLLNELLMGWSFGLISGEIAPGLGAHAVDSLRVLSEAVTSPWFVFPMALEMLLTLRWLRRELPASLGAFLLLQPAVMVCSPPTLSGPVWQLATAVAAAVLMSIAVARFLLAYFRDEGWPPAAAAYALRLILAFGLMSVGLYLWAANLGTGVFALSLVAQMVVFLHASTEPRRYAARPATDPGIGAQASG